MANSFSPPRRNAMAPVQPVANVPMAVAPLYSAPTPQDAEVLKRFLLGAGKAALAGVQFPGDLMHDAARSLRAGRPAGVYADLVETARRVSRDPAAVPGMVVNALKAQAEQARSSPGAMAETMGGMLDVRNMLRRKPTMAELDVYHGTPHTFEPEEGAPLGRFRSSKIGTGEGAQAYGYGLYFAEKESIARHYKDKLAGSGYTYDGVRYDQLPSVVDSPARGFSEKFMVAVKEGATPQEAIERIRRDARETLEITKRHLKEVEDNFGKTVDSGEGWGDLRHFTYDQSVLDTQRKSYERALRDVEIADNLKPDTIKKLEGRLYKIDLPDQKIEQMLDWDKPLSQQPKAFQDAVAKLPRFQNPYVVSKTTGGEAYRELAGSLGSTAKASDLLRQLGIPGVKYLDAGSRAGEKGTRNFVVFPGEEQHLNILSRD